MDLEEAAEKILKRKDADEIECYIYSSKTMTLSSIEKKIEKRTMSYERGVALRVIKDKKIGFEYFTDPKFAETAFDNALKLSKFSKSADYHFQSKKVTPVNGLYSKKLDFLLPEDACETLTSAINAVYDHHAEVMMSDLIVESSQARITNSNGLDASDAETGMYIEISSKCEDGTDAEAFGARDTFNPIPIAEKSAEYSRLMRKPKKIDKQNINVVFDTRAVYNLLLEMFLPLVSGEMARRKISPLVGKENTKILSDAFTVLEKLDAPGCWGSASFDGDGMPASEKKIFDNGVFKGFLYNMETGAKAGMPSTGNAQRSGYTSPPQLSFSNIFVAPGSGFDLQDGLLVHDFMGSHTLDPITGDFSILFDVAFLVKNGEICTPIRQAMLSSNVIDIFKKLDAVDKQPSVIMNLSSPNMLFSDVFVSGS